ncbi:Glycosyl hydrolases family 6 [Nocardioides terrae]|uniref:Glucanase n=1 Tax=Nocardioides terrae TaxID=574651 RepID=A0A1I1JX11_9ACTN|nr:Glycosyl hydrolases family 6 [Nocardioides terrae]
MRRLTPRNRNVSASGRRLPISRDVRLTKKVTALTATALVALAGGLLAPDAARADGSRLPLPAPKTFSGAPYAANPTNPLAGGSWAVNNGFWENGRGLYTDYRRAAGTTKAYLARAALQPSALWLTSTNSFTRTKVPDYLRTVNPSSDPAKLVTVAVFGLWPRGEGARHSPLTRRQQTHYRTWIRRVSAGIGRSRVLVALEPDLAITANRGSDGVRDPLVRQSLTRFAAQYFHDHNPRAAVYLDAGASDWLSPGQAADLLQRSGVQFTRGFSLDITHYTRTSDNITQGAAIVSALAARGIGGKHFVIDTADSGRGYTYAQWAARFGTSTYDNSRRCSGAQPTLCNALGVPPTWQVAQPAYVQALGLTAVQAQTAARDVDAYVWLTRPWMLNQASPYRHTKAVPAAQFTPFGSLF